MENDDVERPRIAQEITAVSRVLRSLVSKVELHIRTWQPADSILELFHDVAPFAIGSASGPAHMRN